MKENETKEIRSSNEQQMTPSHLRDEHEDRGSFFPFFSKDSQLTLVKNPIDDSMIFPCVLQKSLVALNISL